jgi:hypothetical protein
VGGRKLECDTGSRKVKEATRDPKHMATEYSDVPIPLKARVTKSVFQ